MGTMITINKQWSADIKVLNNMIEPDVRLSCKNDRRDCVLFSLPELESQPGIQHANTIRSRCDLYFSTSRIFSSHSSWLTGEHITPPASIRFAAISAQQNGGDDGDGNEADYDEDDDEDDEESDEDDYEEGYDGGDEEGSFGNEDEEDNHNGNGDDQDEGESGTEEDEGEPESEEGGLDEDEEEGDDDEYSLEDDEDDEDEYDEDGE